MRKTLLGLGVATLLAAAGTTTNPTPAQALGWHHQGQHCWFWFHHCKSVDAPKHKKAKKAKKKKK